MKHTIFDNKQENSGKVDLKGKKITDTDKIFQDFLFQKCKEIIELDLSDNFLTKIPNDLSAFERLQIIDLTNNPFENFEQVAYALSTLPALSDLKINLSDQNEALLVLDNLPYLNFLNGKSTKEENYTVDIEDREIESISLNDEITNFNLIFSKISEKLNILNRDKNQTYLEEFQNILKREITKINNCVDSAVPNYVYATNVISSKLIIFKYFQNKYLEYLDYTDKESAAMLREIGENIMKSSDFLINIIFSLYPKIDDKTSGLKKELNDALKSAKLVESEILNFEDKIKLANKEREFLISQHQEEKSLLLQRIEALEQENKVMTEKLLKNAKELISTTQTKRKMSNSAIEKPSREELYNAKDNAHNVSNMLGVNESMNKSKISSNLIVGPNGTRVLTVKMMKDMINEIYMSKEEYDKKCLESKLPKETMEQHMYTYLNQKYGLKSLIVEWATSLINGIKMYSAEDSEVCLFGKILRNELDEETRFILQKLKSTLNDLLLYMLRARFPLKSNSDIKELVNQKLNGYLVEEEWRNMIVQIYENEDAMNLESKIIEFIRKKGPTNKPPEPNEKKFSREEIMNMSRIKEEYKISFKDFQKIVLDFQIKSRDRYLKNFVALFRRSDSDNNGIINEEEFFELLKNLNVYDDYLEENAIRLLNIIDPHNHKQIIFTECVSLFKMEMLQIEDQYPISLLDKISTDAIEK